MAMARTTPRVAGATLFDPADAAQAITVGMPPWYAWLARANTFAFIAASGRFTARKELRGPADGYWRAYRKHAGVVRSAYLGRTADLTLERLHAVAAMIATPAPARDAPTQSVAGTAAPGAGSSNRRPCQRLSPAMMPSCGSWLWGTAG